VIGVLDIGGTHVTAARVDSASASVDEGSRRRIALAPDGTREELLGAILRAAAGAADRAIRRWGIAAPGPFDYEKGVFWIRGVGKLEALYGVDLRGELASSLELGEGTSIRFLNDADAFLLGEWWAGAARDHARAIGLTLGTGLGSAFLADGRIVHEGPGVFPGGRAHVLDFRGGPVEDTISRRGLLARYGAGADGSVDVKEVADRARTGEPLARRTFADFAGSLAEFLTPCLSAFAPTCLVIGGSIAHAWDLIGPTLERALAPVEAIHVVTAAEQIEDAPLLGAARAAA
jgi:glucokinase